MGYAALDSGLLVPEDVKATAAEVAGVSVGYSGTQSQPTTGKLTATQLLKMYREWVYGCVSKNALGVARTRMRLYFVRESKATRTFFRTKAVSDARCAELEKSEHLAAFIRKAVTVEEVVDDHPFYTLWDKGNPHLTGSQLKRMILMHMDLVGDFFGYIVDGEIGPEYLIVLPPDKVRIEVSANLVEVIQRYWLRKNAQDIPLEPDSVIHCFHPDPADPIWGLSPLEAVGLDARVYHEMTEFDFAMLANGAIPSLIGVVKEGVIGRPERERLEKMWNNRFGGASKANKFTVVNADMDFKQFGLTQQQMQSRDNRQLKREDIANAFDVPMSILSPHDVNRASAKEGEYMHAAHGIKPRCVLIEDSLNRTLMPKYDDRLFVAFDDPVPRDFEFDLKREQAYLQAGVYAPNMVLKAHNEDVVAWGEKPRDAYAVAERQAEINAARAAQTAAQPERKPNGQA